LAFSLAQFSNHRVLPLVILQLQSEYSTDTYD
jgi:hypothetical protein